MKLLLIIAFFVVNVTASGYATKNQYNSGYAVQPAYPQQSVNILAALRKNGFTTFVDLIVKAGLQETFSDDRIFIVLAPKNEAFAAIDPTVLAAVLKHISLLRDVLLYHLVLFRQTCNVLSAIFVEQTLNTAQGEVMRFNVYRKKGPSFATEDIATANGVPLLRGIPIGKNIIYPIKKVLNPQDLSLNNTVINFLKSNEDFSIFLSIFEKLRFAQNSFRTRPKTTFVPTNAAFKALPPGVLDSFFADLDKLVVLLNMHIASGTFYTSGLVDGPLVVLSGVPVDISNTPYGITVSNAQIVEPDITVFEGVVHVIDSVIQVVETCFNRLY
ncbi:transforming growth factor-beta-induced protein ig-h3-like [Daphnia carinata]|uniref:transforming growth factor-beta-induced protein ig-h3-like n=1 Tax=Daphnia carinata TaxID=120202 RepID=UPI002868873B|nr:transforming growth factor-beta-induced protein ig-h3-like [Daphnia carinata]